MAPKPQSKSKVIAENRRARFDYFLEDNIEAGIQLLGTEIKALRDGRANIAESYAAVEGREIVLINPEEMSRLGLAEGQPVKLECAIKDGHERVVRGLRVVGYDLPDGCVAAYYPEVNALIPAGLHDAKSKTPAYKGTPVRIRASEAAL